MLPQDPGPFAPQSRPPVKKSFSLSSWRSKSKKHRHTLSDFHDNRTLNEPLQNPFLQDNQPSSPAHSHSTQPPTGEPSPDGLSGSVTNTQSLGATLGYASHLQELDLIKIGQITQHLSLIAPAQPGTPGTDSYALKEFDQLSLSSIGSQDGRPDSGGASPHPHQSHLSLGPQPQLPPPTKLSTSHNSGTTSGASSGGGMVDDLMPFDQLGSSMDPSAPYSYTRSYFNSFHSTSPPTSHPTRSDRPLTHRFINNVSRSASRSNDWVSGGLDPQHEVEEEEESPDDILVGATMRAVSKTRTDLVGFLVQVVGRYDFEGLEPGDLSFKKGDTINVVEKIDDHWWRGSIGLRKGIFPVNRVSLPPAP